jgi:dTDP-4-dehydrorhamnose 3,5-epimerase
MRAEGITVQFSETAVKGVFVIDLEPVRDDRGFFARAWCPAEFAAAGLLVTWAQENVAYNRQKGTLRGLHYQRSPHWEVKLVRCTRGSVWDVAVDLRPESSSYRSFVGVELSADNRRSLYIPEGCAHGYLTLTDDVEMRYLTSRPYAPEAAMGVLYDDPELGISWPGKILVVSENDRTWPALTATAPPELGDSPEAK